jgi:hypothetical protein
MSNRSNAGYGILPLWSDERVKERLDSTHSFSQ